MEYVIFFAVIFFIYKIARLKTKTQINDKIVFLDDTYSPQNSTQTQQTTIAEDFKWQYWDETEEVPVSATLNFDYTNANGENSNRTVKISRYNGTVHLQGFCSLRQETRTFRLDRMGRTVDTETGEIIDDVAGYLLAKYRQSVSYLVRTDDRIRESLRILYYMGKADSRLQAKERVVICEAIRHISGNNLLTDDEINMAIDSLSPLSLQAFKLAVGKLIKIDRATMVNVKKWAAVIVNTQKTAHANENEALAYIDKKIEFITEPTA